MHQAIFSTAALLSESPLGQTLSKTLKHPIPMHAASSPAAVASEKSLANSFLACAVQAHRRTPGKSHLAITNAPGQNT
jgi:hypothetical protein